MQLRLLFFTSCLFISIDNLKSQTVILFENVIQTLDVHKPLNDSAYFLNFEYLTTKQLSDLRQNLNLILKYRDFNDEFIVFYEPDETSPLKRKELREILIHLKDSIDVFNSDKMGNEYYVHTAVPSDSTWFYNNVAGFKFKEDWVIDTVRFTCNINSKYYTPLVYLYGKEELGTQSIITIKPASEQKSLSLVTDFILTDVYIKYDPIAENEITIRESNTEIDTYKIMRLINTIIDKAKLGTLTCYKPIIPFNSKMTTRELKSIFRDEVAINNNDHIQVRYKLYCYRFKLVEKWHFDVGTLAFKKEALGIVLMKRNEINDLSKYNGSEILYTFSPITYIPFNKK